MFYSTFYIGERAFHMSIRAIDMPTALQRICDFTAGVNTGKGSIFTARIEDISVKPKRGVEYSEGF